MLQAKSAQKRQTAIPLKRRNPVDGTLVIILIMLLLAGLLVLFSATFYTGTSTRSPYSAPIDEAIAAMEADGTLRALKERWGLSLVTEADVEAEQSAGGTGRGAGDPADGAEGGASR